MTSRKFRQVLVISQSIPSISTSPRATPGYLTKSLPGGRVLSAQIVLGGGGVDRVWEVAKIQHTGPIPTQNHFSRTIQSMKQNLLSVLRTVKYAVMFCN